MPRSLSQLYVHSIFGTKDRVPFLTDDIRERVHAYLATALRDMGSPFVVVGGVADHVHILFDLGRNHAVKDFVEQIKRESSKFIKTLRPDLDVFSGSAVTGFSPSAPPIEKTWSRLSNRKKNIMAKHLFRKSFESSQNRYGIKFDQQYVWD